MDPARLLGEHVEIVDVHPLEVSVNDEHHRYALLYATLGWTARAAALFDDPETRRTLQQGRAGLLSSLLKIAPMYFQE